MKRKPSPPPQRKYPVRADDVLVGDETPRSSSVFVARHAVVPAKRRPTGWVAGCWVGGLSLLVGIVALLVSLYDPPVDTGEQIQAVQAVRRGGDDPPGYARSSTGGYARGNPSDANLRISAAQAFLNAPFPKRR